MKKFKTYIAAIIVLSHATLTTKCQTSDECKYLMVLTYLRTNTKVNETIKAFFPKMVSKKDKYIDFNLSNRIDFISISPFKDKLNDIESAIRDSIITDPAIYYKKYFFESFRSEFLRKLIQPNNSKLFLTFSKPIENYLIVELGNFDPELNQKVKYGKGMNMFFYFDSLGLIKNVFFSGSSYN